MNFDRLSEDRLFQNHPKETVEKWCKGLKYFHYMRARAGHSCEGDVFAAHFRFEGRDDLISSLKQVGITLNVLGGDTIAFDPFGSYSIDDLDKIRYPIAEFKDLEQPKDVTLHGYNVHIWIQDGRFEIAVSGGESGNAYEVSDADFEVCLALEKEFDMLGWASKLDDEVKNLLHCISEVKYPELYR